MSSEQGKASHRLAGELALPIGSALAAILALSACTVQARFEARSPRRSQPTETAPTKPAPGEQSASNPAEPAKAPPQTQPAAPPRAKVTLKGHQLQLEGRVDFAGDSSAPTPDSAAVLSEVKAYLAQNPRVTRLRIEAHTHNQRDAEQSLQLSGKRALAVKSWLQQAGIAPDRLVAVGFGFDVPIASNATPEGQSKNERIAFHIAELDGKPYLGLDPLAGGTEFQ